MYQRHAYKVSDSWQINQLSMYANWIDERYCNERWRVNKCRVDKHDDWDDEDFDIDEYLNSLED